MDMLVDLAIEISKTLIEWNVVMQTIADDIFINLPLLLAAEGRLNARRPQAQPRYKPPP